MAFPTPTPTYHTTTYADIDPTLAQHSQHGKSVAITGGGSGIGQAIALSFAKASVSHLALLGRTASKLTETASLIAASYPSTKVSTYTADITSHTSLTAAFSAFAATTTTGTIDTLIANAGHHPGFQPISASDGFRDSLTNNAIGTLTTLTAFVPFAPPATLNTAHRARIIHTSSAAAQVVIPNNAAYCVSKAAAAQYVQAFAAEHPDIWVCNFHPGIVPSDITTIAEESGGRLGPHDDVNLAADWTVWAASGAGGVVPSGRFLWAHWDVKELVEIFKGLKGKDGIELGMGMVAGQRFTFGLLGWP